RDELPKYVMVLSGDHIYRQDYGHILAQHVKSGAKMTVSTIAVPIEQARNAFGVISIDENSKIIEFAEKPSEPTPLAGSPGYCLASMGNYVFDTDFLFEQLERDSQQKGSERDFGKDIIPAIIDNHDVYAFEFSKSSKDDSYWRDVGTLDSYWEANMELVTPVPALNIYDKQWPIWTYQEQLPPAKFVMESNENRGEALNSVVSGGCIISGATLVESVCFSNVRVKSGSRVEQTVILPEVTIGAGSRIRKAIIDRGCQIPEGTVIGHNHDDDRARGFRVSENGVVLVTKTELENL
ncbi:MAG: glucose-1-phosphate adenylyltransferase, partial [Congregibacter sp.]